MPAGTPEFESLTTSPIFDSNPDSNQSHKLPEQPRTVLNTGERTTQYLPGKYRFGWT